MKLNFKDLKQQKFTIDAEPSETVGQLKEKIATEKGWEASSQRLIYSGKILADANTIESYKIEEKGFIVCMITKPKAAPVPKPAALPATPAQPVSTPAQPPAPQHQPAPATANVPSTPTPAQTTTPSTTAPSNDPSNTMLIGSQSESTIREMESMGFPRADAERALRAAYGNPDRAIEYLLNGIPAHIQAEQRQATGAQGGGNQPAANPAATQGGTPAAAGATAPTGEEGEVNLFEAAAAAQGGGGGGGARGATGGRTAAPAATGAGLGAAAGLGAGGEVDMNFLRNNPQFQQIRQIVQQQPAMLEPILQQVAEGNPQLAQMIGQNQEQFLQLLAEDIPDDGEGPLPPGTHAITVSPEERDAIERLCRLGFSRDQVIQAYFVCDKNEELAANYLFEQPEDEDDQPPAASGP